MSGNPSSGSGPTAVEYAVMLTLIIIVCVTAIAAVNKHDNQTDATRPNATAK